MDQPRPGLVEPMTEVTRAARVGRMIKDAREQAGVTQAELARRLRVTPPYVANVEQGIKAVSLRQLDRIAAAIPATVRLTIEPDRQAERVDLTLKAQRRDGE